MDVQIYGKIKDHEFHMIKMAVETLDRTHKGALKLNLHELTDTDWESFLTEKKTDIRGEIWGFKNGTMAFVEGELIGNGDDFMRWTKDKFGMIDFRPPAFYEALANQAYKGYLENTDREFVYVDFTHDKRPMGRVIFELYKDIVPDTVKNFVDLLCSKTDNKKFASTSMHRIVKNGWVQGGDFVNGSGGNNESFEGGKFSDENYAVKHLKRGTIGMANDGPHTNGSQFYITFAPAPWMDQQYVAFGCLIEGMSVLDDIENVETYNERPKRPLCIHDCGLLKNAL